MMRGAIAEAHVCRDWRAIQCEMSASLSAMVLLVWVAMGGLAGVLPAGGRSAAQAAAETEPVVQRLEGVVVRIADGDTLTLLTTPPGCLAYSCCLRMVKSGRTSPILNP